jgi:hypothetical protein
VLRAEGRELRGRAEHGHAVNDRAHLAAVVVDEPDRVRPLRSSGCAKSVESVEPGR